MGSARERYCSAGTLRMFVMMLLASMIVGCSGSAPIQTEIPTHPPLLTPTLTLTETPTPTVTHTQTPEDTLTPESSPTPEIAPEVARLRELSTVDPKELLSNPEKYTVTVDDVFSENWAKMIDAEGFTFNPEAMPSKFGTDDSFGALITYSLDGTPYNKNLRPSIILRYAMLDPQTVLMGVKVLNIDRSETVVNIPYPLDVFTKFVELGVFYNQCRPEINLLIKFYNKFGGWPKIEYELYDNPKNNPTPFMKIWAETAIAPQELRSRIIAATISKLFK